MKNSLNGRYHTRVVVNIIYSAVVACLVDGVPGDQPVHGRASMRESVAWRTVLVLLVQAVLKSSTRSVVLLCAHTWGSCVFSVSFLHAPGAVPCGTSAGSPAAMRRASRKGI